MKSFAAIDQESDGNYLRLLSAVSKLSGLFSESAVPFINYRVAENIFCRSFSAGNLSRSDTAFDAKYGAMGIGLKTFVCNGSSSTEKVAEFNSLSRVLQGFSGKELAVKLGEYRNERINLAKRVYGIEDSIYHIVARKENELVFYETDYDLVDIENINDVKENRAGLQFNDGKNLYTYNYSKSTLFRKFDIPNNAYRLKIEIIEDPYTLLLETFESKDLKSATDKLVKGEDYVILPLYGIQDYQKFVFEKSGLNQWNAGGRKRHPSEIYIPIPAKIHEHYPDFFPPRNQNFNLQIPTGEVFSAKVCQENSKALMTNPNKAMSDWLLRNVLQLGEREMATIEKLDKLGFDSVIVTKDENGNYQIDIMKTDSYVEFMEDIED